jgi:hypothetical protein
MHFELSPTVLPKIPFISAAVSHCFTAEILSIQAAQKELFLALVAGKYSLASPPCIVSLEAASKSRAGQIGK